VVGAILVVGVGVVTEIKAFEAEPVVSVESKLCGVDGDTENRELSAAELGVPRLDEEDPEFSALFGDSTETPVDVVVVMESGDEVLLSGVIMVEFR
jgi:hypothetical protein